MKERVVRALGDDYKSYQAFSYPTDNFGVATMYDGDANDASFLCDTWSCLSTATPAVATLPSNAANLMDLNGFAAVGNNGGSIAITEKEQKQLALEVLLPQIYSVLKANGGYNRKSVTTTSLVIGQAWPRKLRRLQIIPLLNGLAAADPRKQAFNAGRLSVIVGDVVVSDMKLTIGVDNSAAANLDALFDPNVPKVKLFSDAKLGVKMSSSVSGTYQFEITKPVILLRLAKKQPSAGALQGAGDDFDAWPMTTVPIPRD